LRIILICFIVALILFKLNNPLLTNVISKESKGKW